MAVANAAINFRTMGNLKAEAFAVIENYGFTPSQVFNLFLTEIAKTKTIPLNLSYLNPNAETLQAMAEVRHGEVECFEVNLDKNIATQINQLALKESEHG